MGKKPYMPFWWSDWRNDQFVRALDFCGEGLFLNMLIEQWVEGSLPEDPSMVRRVVGGDKDAAAWDRWGELLLDRKFPVCVDGRRRNDRLERARQSADKVSSARSVAAHARWKQNKTKEVNAIADAKRMPSYSNSNSESKKQIRSRFWWDEEKQAVWGEEKDRDRLRSKWIELGLSRSEFQRQMRKLNRWLATRPEKRRSNANLANRVNNWMNNYLERQEQQEDGDDA